jgi:hypothetical protein
MSLFTAVLSVGGREAYRSTMRCSMGRRLDWKVFLEVGDLDGPLLFGCGEA